MPPGLRLTRSHISTVEASLNPFHTSTSRPVMLLLNLLAKPGAATTTDPSAPVKASPSPTVNVLVKILPRNTRRSDLTIGYTDGKVEKFALEEGGSSSIGGIAKKIRQPGQPGYAKAKRKEEEVMSVEQLVNKVDAWARVLKAKDEGNA